MQMLLLYDFRPFPNNFADDEQRFDGLYSLIHAVDKSSERWNH